MNFFEDFFGFVTGSGGFEALIQGEGTMIPQARRLACPCSLFASIKCLFAVGQACFIGAFRRFRLNEIENELF